MAFLRKHQRLEVEEAERLTRRIDEPQQDQEGLDALGWISDRDLLFLIERLPLAQRQVLVLRFMLGLTTVETAGVLERTPASVRMLQSRAPRFLKDRLTALGRAPSRRPARARGWPRQARVRGRARE